MKIVLFFIVAQLALASAEQSKIWSIISKMANKVPGNQQGELVELMQLRKTMIKVNQSNKKSNTVSLLRVLVNICLVM